MSAERSTTAVEPTLAARSTKLTVKGAKRAQQILDIAETLFHRQGYAQTSMEDIATASGLLKGSLYHYVSSKEDLLYMVVNDVHEVSRRQLDDARAREDLSVGERLLYFVDSQVRYNAAHVTRVAVYHHEWHRLEGARHLEVKERRKEYDRNLIDLIEEAAASGEITLKGDSRAVMMSVLAVICWPYTWYRQDALSPDALADVCVDFVRHALRVVTP